MAGGAVGIGGVLDLDEIGFELAVLIEGFWFPVPCAGGVLVADDAQADQGCGIRAAKGALLNESCA